MSEIKNIDLSWVSETALVALYLRAMESKRPDALMKDEKAEALVAQMSYDLSQAMKIPMMDGSKVMRIMLTRQVDRYTRDFLRRYPTHSGPQFIIDMLHRQT